MIERIVADGRVDVVSVSYGICDVEATSGGVGQLPSADRLRAEEAFRAAAAQGITIFVASGDQGAYSCQRFDPTDLRPTTSWPGDSPWVVSVGGTRLSLDAEGGRLEEVGWEDVLSTWSGGGGLNPRDPRPDWQRGPGVGNELSNGNRQVPDVASVADPDTGFLVVFGGKRRIKGGTSAAAPLWAGLAALIGQRAEQEEAGPLGFLAPLLYEAAQRPTSPFFDVVRGGDRLHNAGPGWDYATGLGTPRADMLADAIVELLRGR